MNIKTYEQLPEDAKYIRRKVFIEEQGFENEFDATDDIALHIVIYETLEPVATCRIYFSEQRGTYVIGRIAVLQEYRGKNYGAQLLKAAETEIRKRQGECIELSAQVRVSDFYKKYGFQASNEVHDDEGCPHVWMKKELNECKFFRSKTTPN